MSFVSNLMVHHGYRQAIIQELHKRYPNYGFDMVGADTGVWHIRIYPYHESAASRLIAEIPLWSSEQEAIETMFTKVMLVIG